VVVVVDQDNQAQVHLLEEEVQEDIEIHFQQKILVVEEVVKQV
jgi:hypothetical protein